MSLDLMVVMKERISKSLREEIHALFIKERFKKDKYGYHSTDGHVSLDVCYSTAADIRWYWTDSVLLATLGFTPEAEINLESRHTQLSHITAYKLAKKIATLVEGIIYDPQVGELYDHNGKHLMQGKKRERVFKYGAGMDLFMKSVGLVKKLVTEKDVKKNKAR